MSLHLFWQEQSLLLLADMDDNGAISAAFIISGAIVASAVIMNRGLRSLGVDTLADIRKHGGLQVS